MTAVRAQRIWAARSWQSDLLLPVSWLFGLLAALRRFCYRRGLAIATRLRVPVIVVGNIVVGGTGKTPLAIALVKALQHAGYHPGVISRGYGGAISRAPSAWSMVESDDAIAFGDEIVLIRAATGVPCAIGAARSRAGEGLLQRHPEVDVIVADDGLQHYPLARDIELAVFDERGLGNARLLPSGPLREPASRLARVNAVVFNDTSAELQPAWLPVGVASFSMQLREGKAWQLIDPKRRVEIQALSEQLGTKNVQALAGIGHPERFFAMLEGAGLQFQKTALSDHFKFPDGYFASLSAELILITEKDAVKCLQVADPRVWVVPVTAELDAALIQLVLEKLVATS
jgi:tetraacyldisaccharide 4'-kinase